MRQFRDSRYWVTEDGEVFKYHPKRTYTRKNGYIQKWTKADGKKYGQERWYKMKPTERKKSGYLVFNLQCPSITDKGYLNISVHQMVAELYCDGYFEGAQVDHIDCNKQNNHYTNLQWCTKEYNNTKRDDPTYPLFCNSQRK